MKKEKNKIKVGEMIGNPDHPMNEIVRHMRRREMESINSKLGDIRAVITTIFYMADGGILGESSTSEGLAHILDNTVFEIDEFRRDINGETEEEEGKRIRKENKKKAA